MITKDEFELWQANPVTEAVHKALAKLEQQNKQKWMDVSWDGGNADPAKLVELKAWARASQDLRELTFEELEEAMNETS